MKTLKYVIIAALISAVIIVAGSWVVERPSHTRIWRDDYSRVPQVHDVENGYVVENIRNWSYDTVTGEPVVMEWQTATITPETLETVYFVLEPFSSNKAIAHTMLSFHFTDGSAYIVSIEARREIGETYEPIRAALLPTYEYLFVWTTERDMYGNSQFYAGDELYRYELMLTPEQERYVLQAMLAETKDIAARPRWYNTLFANCTNVLADVLNKTYPGALPWHYARVMPGFSEEYLYKRGYFDTSRSLEELTEQGYLSSHIEVAYKEHNPDEFSRTLTTVMESP